MIVACVALFVALGGASYAAIALPANSVATKQIKKQAVTSAKLRARSVTPSKVAPSTIALFRGQTGAPGLPGPKGDNGAPGQDGKNGVSGYQVITTQSAYDTAATKTLNVQCPAGKVPIGGGADTSLPTGSEVISESAAIANGNGLYRWQVAARNTGVSTSWALIGQAACVNAG